MLDLILGVVLIWLILNLIKHGLSTIKFLILIGLVLAFMCR